MKDKLLSFVGLVLATVAIGWVDGATGTELELFVLYFFPIALAAWRIGLPAGIGVAVLSTGLWHFAARNYSNALFGYWALAIMLAAFLSVSYAAARIRRLLEEQTRLNHELTDALAKIQHLTGSVPICLGCRSLQEENGQWQPFEHYLLTHSDDDFGFNHAVCPVCRAAYERDRRPPASIEIPASASTVAEGSGTGEAVTVSEGRLADAALVRDAAV